MARTIGVCTNKHSRKGVQSLTKASNSVRNVHVCPHAQHEEENVNAHGQSRHEEANPHADPVVVLEVRRFGVVGLACVAPENTTFEHVFCQAEVAVPCGRHEKDKARFHAS